MNAGTRAGSRTDWYVIADIPTFIETGSQGYDTSKIQRVPQR